MKLFSKNEVQRKSFESSKLELIKIIEVNIDFTFKKKKTHICAIKMQEKSTKENEIVTHSNYRMTVLRCEIIIFIYYQFQITKLKYVRNKRSTTISILSFNFIISIPSSFSNDWLSPFWIQVCICAKMIVSYLFRWMQLRNMMLKCTIISHFFLIHFKRIMCNTILQTVKYIFVWIKWCNNLNMCIF